MLKGPVGIGFVGAPFALVKGSHWFEGALLLLERACDRPHTCALIYALG